MCCKKVHYSGLIYNIFSEIKIRISFNHLKFHLLNIIVCVKKKKDNKTKKKCYPMSSTETKVEKKRKQKQKKTGWIQVEKILARG